jgi:hypothetical protein
MVTCKKKKPDLIMVKQAFFSCGAALRTWMRVLMTSRGFVAIDADTPAHTPANAWIGALYRTRSSSRTMLRMRCLTLPYVAHLRLHKAAKLGQLEYISCNSKGKKIKSSSPRVCSHAPYPGRRRIIEQRSKEKPRPPPYTTHHIPDDGAYVARLEKNPR